MTVLIGAKDVEASCDMPELVAAIEHGFLEEAHGELLVPPRLNLPTRDGFLRMMPAIMNGSGIMGFKVFHGSVKAGARYLVAVYEQDEGRLLALLDGHYLTAARTGAATGVATKYLARSDSTRVAMIGSGLEARTNLAAVLAVRQIVEVNVFSPRPESRDAFVQHVKTTHGISASAVDSAEKCARGADIVVVATNTNRADDPIAYRGAWFETGVHLNTIGSTNPRSREVDIETFARADVLVVDSERQVKEESGDAIGAIEAGTFPSVSELSAVVSRQMPARTSSIQRTVFKSVGTAMQDVAAGFAVYEAAVRAGRGTDIGEFLDRKKI
jgi:alanine dehydrogenase